MVSYLDALAAQFNYYSWVGALLASFMAGVLAIGTQLLVKGLRIRGGVIFVFVPALVLMGAWSSYYADLVGLHRYRDRPGGSRRLHVLGRQLSGTLAVLHGICRIERGHVLGSGAGIRAVCAGV